MAGVAKASAAAHPCLAGTGGNSHRFRLMGWAYSTWGSSPSFRIAPGRSEGKWGVAGGASHGGPARLRLRDAQRNEKKRKLSESVYYIKNQSRAGSGNDAKAYEILTKIWKTTRWRLRRLRCTIMERRPWWRSRARHTRCSSARRRATRGSGLRWFEVFDRMNIHERNRKHVPIFRTAHTGALVLVP